MYICRINGIQYSIRDDMVQAINDYIKNHIPVGSFLQAVICNNLAEAVGQADQDNLQNLPAFVNYFYNIAPSICWKSLESYNSWINKKRD